MAWLVSKGRVLASAEQAVGRGAKLRGLLGRDSFEGAFVIPSCRSVHTIGMRFPIDVAYLDATGTVIRVRHMHRHRIDLPVRYAVTVVEGMAGSFERWELKVGDVLEVRE
jgi:uncharacterized membrane protein (UPF0127 family)